MKIVIETATGRALYIFPDAEEVEITSGGMVAEGMQATDIRLDTHEIVESVPAPVFWHGGVLSWDGSAWAVTNQTVYLAERKAEMKAAITARRWEVETGGTTVNGAAIQTDAGSQAKLSGALQLVQADNTVIIDWKGADGWVQLNAAAVTAISAAVGTHVQAAFSREKTLHDAVDDAANAAALDLIDIDAGSIDGSGSW